MKTELYCGDCLEILPKLADKSVDMILTDLPYGTTRNQWDRQLPLQSLWSEYERVIKDKGAILLFAQLPFDKQLAMSNPKLLRYDWTWIKSRGTGFMNAKKMPLKRHENILVFYKQLPKYNPQFTPGKPYVLTSSRYSRNYDKYSSFTTNNPGIRYPTSILQFNTEQGLHPTQKPVALCEYLVKTYTDEGDTVLDNCMGSGTVGVACRNQNRDFIGIEKEKNYFDMAYKRIHDE